MILETSNYNLVRKRTCHHRFQKVTCPKKDYINREFQNTVCLEKEH